MLNTMRVLGVTSLMLAAPAFAFAAGTIPGACAGLTNTTSQSQTGALASVRPADAANCPSNATEQSKTGALGSVTTAADETNETGEMSGQNSGMKAGAGAGGTSATGALASVQPHTAGGHANTNETGALAGVAPATNENGGHAPDAAK